MRIAALAVILLLSACEERVEEPLTRGQVMSIADHLLEREGLDWGPIDRVWPPEPGLEGRLWWQVDYHGHGHGHGPTGGARPAVVLVDRDSGWARLPPPEQRVRVPLQLQRLDEAGGAVSASPWQPAPGSWILMLEEGEATGLSAEAGRLNALARETGLRPLFVVREPRLGPAQLVYGWTGSHGIESDERVVAWLRRHRPDGAARWLDLSGP